MEGPHLHFRHLAMNSSFFSRPFSFILSLYSVVIRDGNFSTVCKKFFGLFIKFCGPGRTFWNGIGKKFFTVLNIFVWDDEKFSYMLSWTQSLTDLTNVRDREAILDPILHHFISHCRPTPSSRKFWVHSCNGPSSPLVDIVLFRLSLPGFPSRFLKRVY